MADPAAPASAKVHIGGELKDVDEVAEGYIVDPEQVIFSEEEKKEFAEAFKAALELVEGQEEETDNGGDEELRGAAVNLTNELGQTTFMDASSEESNDDEETSELEQRTRSVSPMPRDGEEGSDTASVSEEMMEPEQELRVVPETANAALSLGEGGRGGEEDEEVGGGVEAPSESGAQEATPSLMVLDREIPLAPEDARMDTLAGLLERNEGEVEEETMEEEEKVVGSQEARAVEALSEIAGETEVPMSANEGTEREVAHMPEFLGLENGEKEGDELQQPIKEETEAVPEPTPEEFRVYALLCAFAALYVPCYILYKASVWTSRTVMLSLMAAGGLGALSYHYAQKSMSLEEARKLEATKTVEEEEGQAAVSEEDSPIVKEEEAEGQEEEEEQSPILKQEAQEGIDKDVPELTSKGVEDEAETEETAPLLEATATSSSEPEKVPTPSAEESTSSIPSASAPVGVATGLHASLPSPVPTSKGLSTAEDKAVGQQGGAAVTPERMNEDKRVNNDKPVAVRLGAAAGDPDLQDLLSSRESTGTQSSGSSTGGERALVVARGGAAGQASSVFNPVMTKAPQTVLPPVRAPKETEGPAYTSADRRVAPAEPTGRSPQPPTPSQDFATAPVTPTGAEQHKPKRKFLSPRSFSNFRFPFGGHKSKGSSLNNTSDN